MVVYKFENLETFHPKEWKKNQVQVITIYKFLKLQIKVMIQSPYHLELKYKDLKIQKLKLFQVQEHILRKIIQNKNLLK